MPVGKDEKENKLIKKSGQLKDFSFKIKSHVDLGLKNKGIDFDTAIKLSGSRFVVLKDKFFVPDYRVRIRTNIQIFWDHIFIATDVTNKDLGMISLQPVLADLHYRGFSALSRKDFSSPHLPDYYDVTTGQKWRDLTGVYTRYGDVLPLLLESDSKYVSMNAGDENSRVFTVTELPELPSNWTRDFLL